MMRSLKFKKEENIMPKKKLVLLLASMSVSSISMMAFAETETNNTISTTRSPSSFFPHTGRALAYGTVASDVKTVGGDAMLPVYGNNAGFAFADFMGDYGNNTTYLVSPGLGYRQVINNQIMGGYFFGDYNRGNLDENFWVLSPGFEWMTSHWDAHVNGYFPIETSIQTGNTDFLSTYGNNSQVGFETGTHNQYDEIVAPYAVIGNGVDMEVGYSFAELSGLRSRVYIGGYYYSPPNDSVNGVNDYSDINNITGVTAGFEQPINKNLHLSIYNSYDNINNYVVGVSLTATFGQDSTVFSNNIQDRLLDPVERHVGIINTAAGTYDQQDLQDVGYGLQYDNVYFISPSTDSLLTNDNSEDFATYGHSAELTQNTLDTIYAQSPGGSRIYIQGGTGAVYPVDASTATQSDNLAPFNELGFYVYGNQDFYGRSTDYTEPASSDEQPIIETDARNYYNGFVIQGGENTFSDLTITESSSLITHDHFTPISGMVVYNETPNNLTLNITNSHITGMDTYGVLAHNDSTGTLTINATNSAFNDNGVVNEDSFNLSNSAAGIYATNYDGILTINAENSTFNGNGVVNGDLSTQAYVSGISTYNIGSGTISINATNSEFNGNGVANGDSSSISFGATGIYADNYGTGMIAISATNSTFNGNGVASGEGSSVNFASGISATDGGSFGIMTMSAINSEFNGNGVASGEGSSVSNRVAGIYANNNQTSTMTVNAINSEFNDNGVASGTGSSGSDRVAGIYAESGTRGTMTVKAINSTFDNNGGYGIFGRTTGGNMTIDYIGSTFLDNLIAPIGETVTSGSIHWIPLAPGD